MIGVAPGVLADPEHGNEVGRPHGAVEVTRGCPDQVSQTPQEAPAQWVMVVVVVGAQMLRVPRLALGLGNVPCQLCLPVSGVCM